MANNSNKLDPSAPINHGGAIDLAAQKYGIPATKWLDLSTGINPVAYPVPNIETCHWQRLPLASELIALKSAAAAYYGVANTDFLAFAPGTQALIQTIPFWYNDMAGATEVHIMGPTYGEHQKCWRRAGHECVVHDTMPDRRLDKAHEIIESARPGSVLILVNPNNPDGKLVSPSNILELAGRAQANGCWMLVDEAFMDCQPDQSVCSLIEQMPRTIILRSFGKFFGLAGARLGCAIMGAELVTELEARIGPWAIPGPTITLGIRAFCDTAWQDLTRKRLSDDRIRLNDLIKAHTPLRPSGATDLFAYYDSTDCSAIATHLARNGILIRLFDHDDQKVRFGFPGSTTDWNRLDAALSQWADLRGR